MLAKLEVFQIVIFYAKYKISGFGLVTPITKIGRLFLIGFAVTGIPLAVATLADLGKFVCHYLCKQIKDQVRLLY